MAEKQASAGGRSAGGRRSATGKGGTGEGEAGWTVRVRGGPAIETTAAAGEALPGQTRSGLKDQRVRKHTERRKALTSSQEEADSQSRGEDVLGAREAGGVPDARAPATILTPALEADDIDAAVSLHAIVSRGVEIAIVQKNPRLVAMMVSHKVLPRSTLLHNAKGERLSTANSERFVRALRLRTQAIDAFGEGTADTWLETPLKRFGGRAPMAMMATEAGARAVEQLIERTMHGFNA